MLLLSGLAGAAALVARSNAMLTHDLGEVTEAEATADAAVVNAISRLSDEKSARHPPVGGQSQTWNFQNEPVSVSITNEAGRIDVNTADDDIILAFLESQGAGVDRATVLLSDLREWQRVRGLRTLDELRQIPSWALQEMDCWQDSLTVYSGLPGVNVADATDEVKAALQFAQDHHLAGLDWRSAGGSSTGVLSDQSMLGDVLRIVAKVSRGSDLLTSSEWVGRLTGDAHQPALTMKWSRAGDSRTTCKK